MKTYTYETKPLKLTIALFIDHVNELLENPKSEPYRKELKKLSSDFISISKKIEEFNEESNYWDISRDFGLATKELFQIDVRITKSEDDFEEKKEEQWRKYFTKKNMITAFKIAWKGIMLYLGFNSRDN